jgi:F-type H+-transporting ATPase subunit b
MKDIIHGFGIQLPYLIAQAIIFMIVFTVINKFAVGPISQILEARRKRIEESEENYAKTKEALASAETEAKAIVAKANEQADRLIKEAQATAGQVAEAKRQETVKEVAGMLEKGREATKLERDQALAELKRDFGRLLIDTTSKVTGKVLTPADHERLNQESAKQLTN